MLIDLRGHGYSDKPRNIEFYDFADDIKFLLDAIYIDETAFIGHEMGALIAAKKFKLLKMSEGIADVFKHVQVPTLLLENTENVQPH